MKMLHKFLCLIGIHSKVDTFEDQIYYSQMSPEHTTVDIEICEHCTFKRYL